MKNFMDNSDEFIKGKLDKETAKIYAELEEKNIFVQMLNLFTGKQKWVMTIMMIFSLIVLMLLIYSINNFINATELVVLIKWGGACLLCVIFMVMMKLYSWMQMHSNNLLREIKRLELLLSSRSK
ncbi:DUF6768 family protein [uncultured Polaribacter sp.]|uniref:DUF6768 family protein n=1 Tax=uncultured Polaribacter sp. TaxID=174711 RepID=UPI00261F56D6|nr:DUF6768 family protein [uncultured Polaribacter sp.]